MVSLSLTACADPGVVTRLEIDDLANFPELQNKVLWSHSGQCYYRRIPGKTVEWDSETQTLVYGASPASSVAHARPASCTPFVWFWLLRERFWRRDNAAMPTALPATGYDHFCPWMGTAVAGGNINAFWSFLGSIVRGRGHSSVAQTRKMHRVVCRVVYGVLLLFCMGACGYNRPYAHQICS